jgi:hypothetical protein
LPLTKSSKVNDFDILWLHISELMVGECAFFLKKEWSESWWVKSKNDRLQK